MSQNPQSLASQGLALKRQSTAGTSLVLSATPCLLNSARCVGNATVAGWLLIYDAVAAPADGTVTPLHAIPVATGAATSFEPPYPVPCANGCVLVFSTTGAFTQTTTGGSAGFLAGQTA